MGSFRKPFSFIVLQLKNMRSLKTWTSYNGDGKQSVLRLYGSIGLSAGCGFVLWNLWKKNVTVTQASCDAVVQETNLLPNSCEKDLSTKQTDQQVNLEKAIKMGKEIIRRVKDETGAPGISIAVSVNGTTVWAQGIGFSNLENLVRCSPSTVMRIASISKSITMSVVGKLIENGKLDLDKPVQTYLPDFPKKTVDGKPVVITCRHLVSHLSGIRHYQKKEETKKGDPPLEGQAKEFNLKENFASVSDSLKLFQDDELFHKPGEKYLYTTHGWTLISAVIEKILNEPFPNTIVKLFRDFGMTESYLDKHAPIIHNRASYYVMSKSGRIENAPYVDNSYKWAGGGFLSTVNDLIKFGNIMLYSYQHADNSPGQPGYLKQNTVRQMWTTVENTEAYGMGWVVEKPGQLFGEGPLRPFYAAHTGGARGASSIVYILPQNGEKCTGPNGVVVAFIANLENVPFSKQAKKLAQIFSQIKRD